MAPKSIRPRPFSNLSNDNGRPSFHPTFSNHPALPKPPNPNEDGEILLEKANVLEENETGLDTTIGVGRQIALCAGFTAYDGGMVFLQLAMLPCLQTLGVPVALVTISGCFSGTLAFLGLPVLGWASDRGQRPRRRKKRAIFLSVLVFFCGLSLVGAGCAVHLWAGRQSHDTIPSIIQLQPMTTTSLLTTEEEGKFDGVLSPAVNLEDSILQRAYAEEMLVKKSSKLLSDPLGLGIPLGGLLGILGFLFIDTGADLSNCSLKSFVLDTVSSAQHVAVLVVGVLMSAVGGCVTAALGVFDMDDLLAAGSSLEPVPLKTLLQSGFYVILTVVCTWLSVLAAPSGQTKTNQITSLPNEAKTLPQKRINYGALECSNSAKTTSGMGSFSQFNRPAYICEGLEESNQSLSTVNSDWTNGESDMPTSALESVNFPLEQSQDVLSEDMTNSNTVGTNEVMETVLDDEESASKGVREGIEIMQEENKSLQPSPTQWDTRLSTLSLVALMQSAEDREATDAEKTLSKEQNKDLSSFRYKDLFENSFWKSSPACFFQESIRSQVPSLTSSTATNGSPSLLDASDQTVILNKDADPESLKEGRKGCSVSRRNRKVGLICLSMFFVCGAWQSFNICINDYLGKVVYGGDPEADPTSQSYSAYQRGMRTGSLGILLLHVTFVLANLVQRKLMKILGAKAEFIAVCLVSVVALLTMILTNNEIVFYVTAVIFGIFRSTMYTIPFMLVNDIFQDEARSRGPNEGNKGPAKVGWAMALLTSMLSLSVVVVSAMTGPLMDATQDPTAPLYYTVASPAAAALIFAFI